MAETRRARDEVGRDFAKLRKTWFGPAAIASTPAEAEVIAADGFSDLNGLVGTPDYFVEKIDLPRLTYTYLSLVCAGSPTRAALN